MVHEKAFCSWSGGKDCFLAYDIHKERNSQCDIVLFTMVDEETKRTYGHNLEIATLEMQAEAMGREIHFGYAGKGDYAIRWRENVDILKGRGVSAGIFGDIDLQAHYDWIDKVTKEAGIGMILPLWKMRREDVVRSVLDRKIEARIVSVEKSMMSEKYLGRRLDRSAIEEMESESIDPSGEGGEFHTFVLDSPSFKKRLRLAKDETGEDKKHAYLIMNGNLAIDPK